MAEWGVNVTVDLDGLEGITSEDAVRAVLNEAARITQTNLWHVWPYKTGFSRARIRRRGSTVVNEAEYADEIRVRGTKTLFVNSSTVRDVAEEAAETTATNYAGTAFDGVVNEVLAPLDNVGS